MLYHLCTWLMSALHASDANYQVAADSWFKALYVLAIIGLCFVVPYFVGGAIANAARLRDHGWKLGLILITVVLGCEIVGRTWDPETNRFNIKLGVDLKGGVILIYEVDESATASAVNPDDPSKQGAGAGRFNMDALVEAIARRINPSGTKEIVIRKYGTQQVEIIIPEVDQREVEQIKKTISTAGVLQFRIVANSRDHNTIIELAREMAQAPAKKRGRIIYDNNGSPVGLWARVGREQREGGGGTFKLSVAGNTIRDAATGDLLEVPFDHRGDDAEQFTQYIASLGIKEIDVLMATDGPYNVTGSHLGAVNRGNDERLRPCILFNLKAESGGVVRFAQLTTDYGPEGGFERQLGIILDNTLLSAPNIQEPITQGRGRITGQFTDEEVAFLVNILEAGSLPVVLNPNPISENQISPLLGRETIEQGKLAIGISLGLVLVFILFYYRFSGIVACVALLLNLLFILALMVLIKGAFTLPGLAGLVLTVGMSVDANVLIFERIREELAKGAALRMAIRNGFDRATTTIIDANVTTLITAIVLYAIGTDQIRGFAVTLILGILMSMYTAIFCSRVAFEMFERTRRISRLRMMQILSSTEIDFVGKRRLAAAGSFLVIIIGLVGIAMRQADMFDIDFRGGTSVQMQLEQPEDTDTVRNMLAKQFAANNVRFTLTSMSKTAGTTKNNSFKIDSSLAEVEDLESAIQQAFAASNLKLATYSLEFGDLRQVPIQSRSTPEKTTAPQAEPEKKAEPASATPEPKAEQPAPTKSDESKTPAGEPSQPADKASQEKNAPAAKTQPAKTEPAAEKKAGEGSANEGAHLNANSGERFVVLQESENTPEKAEPAATDATASNQPSSPASKKKDEAAPKPSEGKQGTAAAGSDTDKPAEDTADATADKLPAKAKANEPAAASYQVEVELKFRHGINAQTLTGEIDDAAKALNLPISDPILSNPNWDGQGSNAFDAWTLRLAANEQQTHEVLDYLKKKFAETPVWPASNKIGGQVAQDMQEKAIAALIASLFGIVLYIWIRFQRVVFGLAAVVALVHDVLVTLGAIAVSAWLTGALGFLLIEEFKISLPIVAALLTIIGYSLNDTIVVFDRIREVRGKSPNLTGEMVNRSINQTLSRTLLTSVTTLIVVIILYALGGEGIHGFAFSLVVGVVVGTYSSIFVASPILLWMIGARSTTGKPAAA